jgi:hypothetical protein
MLPKEEKTVMLKYDVEQKKLIKLEPTKMKVEEIRERYDLQEAILKSWDVFKYEIGIPTAYLIGDEINPHESTQDSIDIMAFDSDDSSLIVIELKRDRNKLQLLQALNYAAMVSKWDQETLISQIKTKYYESTEELTDIVKSNPLNATIKIILISEFYDPEVIITADWLSNSHDLDITAFSVRLHRIGDQIILATEQRFPLKELDEVYDSRRKRRTQKKEHDDIGWEDIIPKLQYTFARKGIELCKKFKSGDASRRRFGNIRKNWDGLDWITVSFREKYINVYIGGSIENMAELLQSKFSDAIEISTWAGGVSFRVDTEKKFNDMVAWLKLE